MKKELSKISDVNQIQSSSNPGAYKDNNGLILHGIYLRTNKHTVDKLYIHNGNLLRKYKYPRINELFSSPLVNDYNLNLCGGWTWQGVEERETIIRVIKGYKPMGFFSTWSIDGYNEMLTYRNEIEDLDDFDLVTLPEREIPGTDVKCHEIGISTTKLFKDCFDLKALKNDYMEYAKACEVNSEGITEFIDSIENQKVSHYLSGFDYGNPNSDIEVLLTGLILGYSINTTVSIMWMNQ